MTTAPAQPRRRWFSFSLRSLLVAVTVFGGWLGWNLHVTQERKRVIAATRLEGGVEYSTAEPYIGIMSLNMDPRAPFEELEPPLVRRLMGDRAVAAIDLPSALSSNEEVRRVQVLFPKTRLRPFPKGWEPVHDGQRGVSGYADSALFLSDHKDGAHWP